jgi:hypothetical protein
MLELPLFLGSDDMQMRTIVDLQTNEVTQVLDDIVYPVPVPPTLEEQEANRRAAYSAEADPLAMQMLREEATKAEWLAKIDEIKVRYPYPA